MRDIYIYMYVYTYICIIYVHIYIYISSCLTGTILWRFSKSSGKNDRTATHCNTLQPTLYCCVSGSSSWRSSKSSSDNLTIAVSWGLIGRSTPHTSSRRWWNWKKKMTNEIENNIYIQVKLKKYMHIKRAFHPAYLIETLVKFLISRLATVFTIKHHCKADILEFWTAPHDVWGGAADICRYKYRLIYVYIYIYIFTYMVRPIFDDINIG